MNWLERELPGISKVLGQKVIYCTQVMNQSLTDVDAIFLGHGQFRHLLICPGFNPGLGMLHLSHVPYYGRQNFRLKEPCLP
jgi:hypothetical protein